MKNPAYKIFPSSPVNLIASVIEKAFSTGKKSFCFKMQEFGEASGLVSDERIMDLCSSPFFNFISQEEINSLMLFVYSRLGLSESFEVTVKKDKLTGKMLECRNGLFKMLIRLNGQKKIAGIDINTKEGAPISLLAA